MSGLGALIQSCMRIRGTKSMDKSFKNFWQPVCAGKGEGYEPL
jgi:hypothetical protein